MRVVASRRASNFIRKKGGDFHVWFGEVGSGSLLVHSATRKPEGRIFRPYGSSEGFRVWIEAAEGIEPSEIQLRRRPWPLGPIEVTWMGGPGGELGPALITDAGSG